MQKATLESGCPHCRRAQPPTALDVWRHPAATLGLPGCVRRPGGEHRISVSATAGRGRRPKRETSLRHRWVLLTLPSICQGHRHHSAASLPSNLQIMLWSGTSAGQVQRDREAALRLQQDLDTKELHYDTVHMIDDNEQAPGPSRARGTAASVQALPCAAPVTALPALAAMPGGWVGGG